MEIIKKKILDLGGAESEYMAFFEYFNGWLRTADAGQGQSYIDEGIQNLKNAVEIYKNIYKTEDHLDIALCYRYLGQLYYKMNDAENSLEGN